MFRASTICKKNSMLNICPAIALVFVILASSIYFPSSVLADQGSEVDENKMKDNTNQCVARLKQKSPFTVDTDGKYFMLIFTRDKRQFDICY